MQSLKGQRMKLKNLEPTSNSKKIYFTFDDKKYFGYLGDTLASALLRNGVKIIGRSFKYHRPRGILTAGSEEPNALVSILRNGQINPNLKATEVELYDNLISTSQNRWPSLKFDFLRINDFLSPFLGAGFYYKTFMWPKSFWEKLYEPVIRSAAGLGKLSPMADNSVYEKAFAFCDVLIIGAGPSGLLAAKTAAITGIQVILADEDFVGGGRLNSETFKIDGQDCSQWAQNELLKLREMPNVRVMTRTTILGVYDGGTYSALEKVGEYSSEVIDHLPDSIFWRIVSKKTVLCSGSIERPIVFKNNDRPGIMMASAVRTFLNRFGVIPGKKIIVFGNNDDARRTVFDLQSKGVEVIAYVDSRDKVEKIKNTQCFTNSVIVNTNGPMTLSAVTIRSGNTITKLKCDCLAISGGWNPSIHLTSHMNNKPIWNETINCFLSRPRAVPNMEVAGSANGVFSTKMAMTSGVFRAREILKELGVKFQNIRVPETENEDYNCEPLWQVDGKGRAWLDFQNDVTVKDLMQSQKESMTSVEHMKRYTTQGMATDQGKNSNVNAIGVMAELTGQTISLTGTTTFRPPFSPVAIGALGAGGDGKRFAPIRKTTSHNFNEERGSPNIEAGLWMRPNWFPKKGELHWRESCDREVNMVRNFVGICDVSTLGKIDVQGPDSAMLLDFVYTNKISSLMLGKIRYGLMLREDGHVMDDGTCARIGQQHYIITTTTAAAGQVMRHLEFVLQVLRPDIDAQVISVTEQWAQFAIAGPKARNLVDKICEQEISNAQMPFMSFLEVNVGEVAARLFRISFSGEHAYEISVAASYGDAMMRLLVSEAELVEGGPYGMEALNVLRIEKGFITHAEIDGRATAQDIGMKKMINQGKDCIGQVSSLRPGLVDLDREQLVGIKPINKEDVILAGAHVYPVDKNPKRINDQGHITSVCYSPTLNTSIALALIKNGHKRHGETLKMVDHLRNSEILVELTSPIFFDATGSRVRG